jgi:hypothetical protein
MLLRLIGAVYTRNDEAAIAEANAAALGRVELVGLNLATPEVEVPSQTFLATSEVRIPLAPPQTNRETGLRFIRTGQIERLVGRHYHRQAR